MFATPKSALSFLLILAIGAGFGLVVQSMGLSGVAPGYLEAALSGMLVLSIPAILASATAVAIKRSLGMRRVLFLSLACEAVYALFYLAALATRNTPQFQFISDKLAFIAFGLAFVIWFLISKFVFNLKRLSFVYPVIQLAYNAAFLLASAYIIVQQNPALVVFKIYFAAFVFLVGAYAAFWIIDAPMKRNFGISSTKAITMFLGQWLFASRDLEQTFDYIGEDIETLVGYMSFKAEKKHLLLVVPYIHYGPFGNLGGSEFSYKICNDLESRLGCKAMSFHGTANHDFDPVSHHELAKITGKVASSLSGQRHAAAKAAFAQGAAGSGRADAFCIGGNVFLGLTRAPLTTEDVDFGVGLSIMNEAEKTFPMALAVDQHNSETGDITYVGAGSPYAFEFLDATGAAMKKLAKAPMQESKIGFASAHTDSKAVGSGGIKCTAIQIGAKVHFIVLADSNGITPQFRKSVLERIGAAASRGKIVLGSAEIYTTDTHQQNMVRGVLNPLGSHKEPLVLDAIADCALHAAADLEDYKFAAGKERIRMRVFGPSQSTEIISTVNSIWAIARIAIPAIILASLLAIIYGLSKF